jgi:AcrR family transcriptional regulator
LTDGDESDAPRRQADRTRETRGRLIAAVVQCLDRDGYTDTSIAAIQTTAGVSRGALMYHFPNKLDLIVATARSLLDAAIRPTRAHNEDLPELLAFSWHNVVNTPEGRAFAEIIAASRTDEQLAAGLRDTVIGWESEVAAAAETLFITDRDDAAVLFAICRTFLRGLLVEARFVKDPRELDQMLARFSDIIAVHLRPRGHFPQD